MKIKLEQRNRSRWEMIIPTDDFDQTLSLVTEEITNWPQARRMSYDTWSWYRKDLAEQFITMFLLKYGK